jgi:small-conductance mechanosensitive channel
MDIQIVIDALTRIVTDIVNFIPNLVNGLIILVVGYLLARLLRWLVHTILVRVRVDQLVERAGVADSLRGLGIRMPLSWLIAQALFLLLLLSFLTTATRLMGLEAVARLLEQLVQFVPNIIAAAIVFVVGGLVAQFVADLVTTAGIGAGLQNAARVGQIVRVLIVVFVAVLALGQLGIDTAILITALTIMIAAFGLALGLALGLGARTVVQHILAGYYLRQRLTAGEPIVLDDVRGEVGGVGSVNTVVTTSEGTVMIPNTVLIESVVRTGASPTSVPRAAVNPEGD